MVTPPAAVTRTLVPMLLALGVVAAACDSSVPLVARTEEPMLYLVLTPDSLTPPETSMTALLATTATPVFVELRSAEQFVMRRISDQATFAWAEVAPPPPNPGGTKRHYPLGGNYRLAEVATSVGLGRRDLVAGETYSLEISTQGRMITGLVTIPARPAPVVLDTGRYRIVSWPRAAAAAAYLLDVDTERQVPPFTTDTFFVLREDRDPSAVPPILRFRITAVDSNWHRYMTDTTVFRAGVRGAYGLLGGTASASIELPLRALASREGNDRLSAPAAPR